MNLERRIRNLHERASHKGTPPEEAAACKLVLGNLGKRYGSKVEDILRALESTEVEGRVTANSHWERQLAIRCAVFLGLDDIYRMRIGGKLDGYLYVKGPETIIECWKELHKEHRKRARSIAAAAALGYSQSAVPVPESRANGEQPKVDPRAMDAYMASASVGAESKLNDRRALPQGARE